MTIPAKSPYGPNVYRFWKSPVAGCTDLVSTGAGTNTAVTVSLAATSSSGSTGITNAYQNIIFGAFWSYSSSGAGNLQISDSTGVIYNQDVTGQNGSVIFDPPITSTVVGGALTAVLGAVASVTGKLNIRGVQEM